MAVGWSTTGSFSSSPLTELWNGSTWTIEPAPQVSSGTNTALYSVSCPSTQFCAAVGAWTGGSVMEIWDGTSWSLASPTGGAPTGLTENLINVSCTTASFCLGVGPGSGVAVQWDGVSWALAPGTSPGGLTGVSCQSETNCTGVGLGNSSGNHALIANWDGTSWSTTTPPTGSAAYALNQLSCVQSTCVAVGNIGGGAATLDQPVVVTESDGSWSFVGSPGVPSSPGSIAIAVSCVEPVCISTGQTFDTSGGATSQTFAMTAPFDVTPSVTGVSPSSGPTTRGTSVTIVGTNFSSLDAER